MKGLKYSLAPFFVYKIEYKKWIGMDTKIKFLLLGFILSACSLSGCADKIKRNTPLTETALPSKKILYVQTEVCDPPSQLTGSCYNSLQRAIDVAHTVASTTHVTIEVDAGHYRERIVLSRSNIDIIGAGKNKTYIQYNLNAEQGKAYHRDGWGTPGSATFTINASEVNISDLTIENTFDFLSNDSKDKTDPSKVRASQGVALLLDEHSDKVALYRVGLYGYQDTLFANGKRAFIYQSDIAGNVDFIFGAGQVVIENSRVISRPRGKAMAPNEITGYITAPSTNIADAFGLVFINSRLEREQGVADASVTLGRPWHPTTNFSDGRYADPNAIGHALFFNCFMDAHIHPARWSSMKGTAKDGSKTLVFTPEQSRFYEVAASGPGASGDTVTPYHEMNTVLLRTQALGDWHVLVN